MPGVVAEAATEGMSEKTGVKSTGVLQSDDAATSGITEPLEMSIDILDEKGAPTIGAPSTAV